MDPPSSVVTGTRETLRARWGTSSGDPTATLGDCLRGCHRCLSGQLHGLDAFPEGGIIGTMPVSSKGHAFAAFRVPDHEGDDVRRLASIDSMRHETAAPRVEIDERPAAVAILYSKATAVT